MHRKGLGERAQGYADIFLHTGFPSGSGLKNPPALQEMRLPYVGQEHPLEMGMATDSSILVWEIPWTEEPVGLQSMGVTKSGS